MRKTLYLLAMLACIGQPSSAQIITTFAGSSSSGYSGDGGAATAAQLSQPNSLAVDTLGNVYIADAANGRVRKVNSAGIITTIAGNGTYAYSGDGGAATNAEFMDPASIALDKMGKLYIADVVGNRIRIVDPLGNISTFAGNGVAGYSGDGGQATAASLNGPWFVRPDNMGNVYFSDALNQRVRKINAAGVITTIAGNGTEGYLGDGSAATTAELADPTGIVLDGVGNIYIGDNNNFRIRKISPTGIITTIAGSGVSGYSGDGGPATLAKLGYVGGLAFDNAGNLYVAAGNRIRKINTLGIITTVVGTGSVGYSGDNGLATAAELNGPTDVLIDSLGTMFIADYFNSKIRKVNNPVAVPSVVLPI